MDPKDVSITTVEEDEGVLTAGLVGCVRPVI